MNVTEVSALSTKIEENIGQVIMGKADVTRKIIISLLVGGHILLEDIPGTGKTTLAKALAKSIDCDFKRVQFTPDLLPSDLTGVNFYSMKEEEFIFKPGAIFTNILLGDEINRATPRTQSSLLECMEEGQASIDGTTYQMAQPFFVIATQNPIEIQGTFPLPEAQLDRFFMKLAMGYPDAENEKAMLTRFQQTSPLAALQPVATSAEVVEAGEAVRGVHVSDAVRGYIIDIVAATRANDRVRLGLSPRGSIALMRAAQAHAAVEGRDYVLPDDVKAICADVSCHRIICRGHQMAQAGEVAGEIIRQILLSVPAPIDR